MKKAISVAGDIILGVIFVIIIIPLGLILRLLRYDPLRLSRHPASAFVVRNKTFTKADFEKV